MLPMSTTILENVIEHLLENLNEHFSTIHCFAALPSQTLVDDGD